MSTKLNIPLLIFALMIQAIFCGILLVMPISVTSQFPSYANPYTAIHSLSNVTTNFGFTAPSFNTVSPYACDASTLFLGCVATPLYLLGQFLIMIFNLMIIGFNIIINIAIFAFVMVVFFMSSSLLVISAFPIWLSIPLGIFIGVIDILLVMDFILVAKGLLENLI